MNLFKLQEKIKSKKIIMVTLVVVVACTIYLLKLENAISGNNDAYSYFKMQLAFSSKSFFVIMKNWGADGVNLYLSYIWIDFIYAIAYSTLLAAAILYFKKMLYMYAPERKPDTPVVDKIAFLPFIAAIFDMTENIIHIMILKFNYANIILASSIVSLIKWIFLSISLLYFLYVYFSFRRLMREAIIKSKNP